MEMDAYLKSKGQDNGYTNMGYDDVGRQQSHDPVMNLLHCFQNTIPMKHEKF